MRKFSLTIFTLVFCFYSFSQGVETFTNLPATTPSSYIARTWTGDNGLPWNATDSRADQTINGSAITIRNGSVTTANIPNGIGNLTFTHQKIFSGAGAALDILVNGISVGSVNPDSTVQTTTISNINVAGTFSLEIKQMTTALRVKIDDISWTGFGGVVCSTPTAQPTNIVFSNINSNSFNGSFTDAAPTADEYLVILSTNNTLSALPQNGTSYDVEDLLGGGTVISRGNTNTFTRSGLIPANTYYVYAFSLNGACSGGPLYNTTSPLTGNFSTTSTPVCTAPTSAPGALTLFPTNSSISGSFTDATGADGYLVIRSISSTLSFTPVDGTPYTAGQIVGTGNTGTVVSFAGGNTFTASGLTSSTLYYFYVYAISTFSCTGGPIYYTTASAGSSTTAAGTSTGEPPGYYASAAGKTCADLKTTLKTIISNMSPKSYNALLTQYTKTDVKPNENGSGQQIWDVYSDNPTGLDPYSFIPGNTCGNYSNEGDCYNREHSFPQNWFGGGTSNGPGTDYHHVFPTDGKVNGMRSNYLYGEVAVASKTSLNGSKLGTSAIAGFTDPVFEPLDSFKGDLARAFLYMVTRYESNIPQWAVISGSNGAEALNPSTFPSVDIPYLQVMLKWHHLDPVSAKEITRNNGAYVFQGNRNPYVDHPDFADLVWNNTCPGLSTLPVDIISFSGKLIDNKVMLEWLAANEINFDHYEIQRSVNNNDFKYIGTVKASNKYRYTFNDDAETIRGQRVYYRVKMVDRDGKFKYTAILSMHIPLNTKFTVYPNPARNFIQMQMNKNVNGLVKVQVTDLTGKLIKEQSFVVSNSTINISTSGIINGTYLVKLSYNGEQYLQKVIVNK